MIAKYRNIKRDRSISILIQLLMFLIHGDGFMEIRGEKHLDSIINNS